jgi:hypothetical protein
MATTLSMSELMATPEFRRLTPRQASFVLKYLVSGKRTGVGDAIGAAAVAYKTKDSKSARAFSYELLGSKNIRAVLNLFYGRAPLNPLEGLAITLRQHLKRAERTMKAIERHIAKENNHANS